MMRPKQDMSQPKMANGSSDFFSIPDDEFSELVWENGQIVMQTKSSRPRKSSFPSAFSQYGGLQEKDSRGCASSKVAHSSEVDRAVDDFAPSRHSGVSAQEEEEDDDDDDDMVPWINYPIDEVLASETLENDYCAEFMNEFTAFDLNPLSAHRNTVAASRCASSGLDVRNSGNVENRHASKAPVGCSESARARTSHLFQLPQQCQSSVPNSKSTVVNNGANGSNVVQEEDRCGGMVVGRLQNQGIASSKQQQQPNSTVSLMNFSHFARPAALAKVSLQNVGGLRSTEKVNSVSRSNPITSVPIASTNGVKDISRVSKLSALDSHKLDLGPVMKALQEGGLAAQPDAICLDIASKNNKKTDDRTKLPDNVPSSSLAASTALCRNDTSKDPDAVVASSSICSRNLTGAASNEPKHLEKRKEYEGDESDYHSDDLQDESVGTRRPANGRVARTKRSRAAEVHNLSERRRRNRINEKMRALQELIPNCNKVDKASMLEEAIEYLKTLQLQVQIMSTGNGLYMPPMMFPLAMPHIRAPTMAPFPPIGVGMGAGIGVAPGCPMIRIPPVHAPQFPCTPNSGQLNLRGIPGPVSPQMYGIQGQGIPVLMPGPPPFGTLPGFPMNSVTDPVPGTMAVAAHPDPATVGTGDQQQRNSNVEPRTSTEEEPQIQASTKVFEEQVMIGIQLERYFTHVIKKGLTKLLSDNAPNAIKEQRFENYSGRKIAIDASMSIYQFLVVVGRNGMETLTNEAGEVTSHLQGMFNRTIRLMEAGIMPVYVFDGQPPELKKQELAKRNLKREDAIRDLTVAVEVGDKEGIRKFSKKTVKVTKRHNEDCKRLLRLMGIPVIEVYAVASEDMDSLTFGAPRFVRHLMDPSSRKIPVLEFEVSKILEELKLSMDQFIDLCILSGCDYCNSIKGIGGQTALKLIHWHGCLENILQNINKERYHIPEDWPYKKVRQLFREPNVSSEIPDLRWTAPDEEGLVNFLVNENSFNNKRVAKAIEKIKVAEIKFSQRSVIYRIAASWLVLANAMWNHPSCTLA
ncbi:unnamed protein product [Musa textilis]